MNILLLKPKLKYLEYSFLAGRESQPSLSGKIDNPGHSFSADETFNDSLVQIRDELKELKALHVPDAVAVRVKYGGTVFREPVLVTPDTIRELEELVADSPLHIPLTLTMIRSCSSVFPGTPVVLVFETSFFTGLPPREYHYGLDTGLQKELKIRKFGFNGIFHSAACDYISQLWRKVNSGSSPRIISICLEPRPEVAAVIGNRAVMTTGGVTPLEGIPGQTTSGEIDPTILLTLVQKKGWGPEEINNILTRQSGLLGLTGQPITFEEFFSSGNKEFKLAREVIRYRILLACGSGIAAMGGCDAIVFSGRYAYMGEFLGPWLKSELNLDRKLNSNEFICDTFYEMHDRIIADTARTLVTARSANIGGSL